MPERVVVVGHSAITCLGRDMDATWQGLMECRSGLKSHEKLSPDRYLRDVAGLVEGYDPGTPTEEALVSRLEAKSIHMAIAAARMALADAGLDRIQASDDYDPHRVAVCVGSAFGGQDLLQLELDRSSRRKTNSVGPYLVPGMIINQASGQIAQHFNAYGPSVSPANACAAGGHSVAMAAMHLVAGEADFAICGGTESAFTPSIVNGFATMKALANRKEGDRAHTDPSQASRPFSADRMGFVMSEGAALLVLATESAARKWGLPVQAELIGWGTNSDGYHVTTPHHDRIAYLLKNTLSRAKLSPSQVDYYNAHGTSTVVLDRLETEVLKEVLGQRAREIPVSSIKGAIGHALGAASAIEAAVCVHSLMEQRVPPTINHVPDPELDLDFVPNHSRPANLEVVVSASFGFGGTNNVLIFKRGDQ